ncbi:hypothetical protein [Nostoc sp.]
MTDDSTITHEVFKQFERDKFSVVAQEYDRALAKRRYRCCDFSGR